MANKSLRFFGTDFNNNQFDGTADASSAPLNAPFAFDGLTSTRWISNGENTDGNSVYLEMNYGFNRTVNSFYVFNTNISDVVVQYWNGAAFVNFDGTNSKITKSADGFYLFVRANTDITTLKVRVIGSNTIVANQEKSVTLFYAFYELGQFQYFPGFKPAFTPAQNVFTTTDGRGFVIERGESFSAKINFVSHVLQADITLAQALLAYKQPFFIWPNGGNESIFRFSFRPFRFQDIYKVTITGISNPEFTQNYYRAGYNDVLSLIEVV